MLKFLKRARSGMTSLETAIIIPVLLVITIGAIDAARLIQAHQTLRDAARVATRCIYPTDAACVSAAVNSNSPGNVFQYQLVDNNRETPSMNYSGAASWLTSPALNFSQFQASTLTDVSFNGHFSTSAYVVRSAPPTPNLAVVGTGNYFEMTRRGVPFVDAGTSPGYDATFYTDASLTTQISPATQTGFGGGLTIGGSESGALSLNDWHEIWSSEGRTASWIPRVVGERAVNDNIFGCVKPAFSVNDATDCSEPGLGGGKRESRIAFDLRGSAISSVFSTFSVRVSYWTPGNSAHPTEVVLHGRQYNGGVSHLLFPRGFPISRIHSPSTLGNQLANMVDNDSIVIPWGKEFNIEVRATGTGSRVHLNSLKIFAPEFETRQTSGSCGCGENQLVTTSGTATFQAEQCSRIYVDCAANLLAPGVQNFSEQDLLKPGNSMATTVAITSEASQAPQYILPIGGPNGCFATEAEALAQRQQTISQAGLTNVAILPGVFPSSSQEACQAVTANLNNVNFSCPANHGVSESVDPATGRIVGSASAMSQCPPSSPNLLSYSNVSWGEGVTAIDHAPVDFVPTSCAAQSPNWANDSVLAAYPKLLTPQGVETGREAVITEHADPAVLKATAQYSCSAFQVASRSFDDSNPLLAQSLFHGHSAPLGCDWENILRHEAEFGTNVPMELKLKGYEYFTAASHEDGWQVERTADTSCAACTTCRFNQTRTNIPGLFTQNQSPAVCSGLPSGTWCESQAFYVVTPGSNGGVNVNESEAVRIALGEIQASIPSAQAGCTGVGCAEVTVIADSATGVVNAAASYNMPLYILGNHSVTLSSSVSESFEHKFSN